MDSMSLANNVNASNATTMSALKKSMETEQNTVAKLLEDSAMQQKQIRQAQDMQMQQKVAQQTGLGINLNVKA